MNTFKLEYNKNFFKIETYFQQLENRQVYIEKNVEVRIESLKLEIEKYGEKLCNRIEKFEKKLIEKNETKFNTNFEIFKQELIHKHIGVFGFNFSIWSQNNSEENNQKIFFVDDNQIQTFISYINEFLDLK